MLRRAVVVCAAAFFAASCGGGNDSATATSTIEHHERGVHVEIEVQTRNDGTGFVEATYTPDNADFHLYATDMAIDGVDGFGRPTLLEIASGAAAVGPTVANEQSLSLAIESLDLEVPVYPDGPITLSKSFTAAEGTLDIRLTYMSCGTDGGCTIPVIDKSVIVDVP